MCAIRGLLIRALFSYVQTCFDRKLGPSELRQTLVTIHRLRKKQGLPPMSDDDIISYVHMLNQ
jgi:hypothetical protein